MKRRHATVYAPNVEQLIAARDEAIEDAEAHKGNVAHIAKKNARLCRILAEHITDGQQLGGTAKTHVDQLAEKLLIEGFNLSIEFAQLRHEAGDRP